MRDPWNDSRLVQRFRTQADTALPRAPLHAALSGLLAEWPEAYGLLHHAPLTQQQPVLLLAAIHDLLLAEPSHPLASWYPTITPDARPADDPMLRETLRGLVHERALDLTHSVATRRVQTNEIGRCALFAPVFDDLENECGPLAHVDGGASAGLNLLLDDYGYRYDDGPVVSRVPRSDGDPLLLECATRGSWQRPIELATVTARIGLDLDPIDAADERAARWLRACCWADQLDRFVRLAAALTLAADRRPEIVAGDLLETIGPTIDRVAPLGHPVLTTSWVLNYVSPRERGELLGELERIGTRHDLSWIIAESPAQTPELPHDPTVAGEHITALVLVTWRSGTRTVRHLGTCHPHGYWIHWN